MRARLGVQVQEIAIALQQRASQAAMVIQQGFMQLHAALQVIPNASASEVGPAFGASRQLLKGRQGSGHSVTQPSSIGVGCDFSWRKGNIFLHVIVWDMHVSRSVYVCMYVCMYQI